MTLTISTCPCCLPATLIGGVIFTWVLFQFLGSFIFTPPSSKEPPSILSRIVSIISKVLGIVLIISALLLGVLEANEDIRKVAFSKLCASMTQGGELDVLRCGLLEGLSGRVLEIGPGPATNFRCLYPPSDVTEWVGVEPNNHFLEIISEQKNKWNISFDTRLTWLKGEDIDVEDEGFDAVIGTHVLCSVSDVNQVLRQVSRVLRPGGTYYFMEHVTAQDPGARLFQRALGPIFTIVADGCQFRDLWTNIDSGNEASGLSEFDIDLRHMKAPIGVPFLQPHIIGKAVKRL